MNGKVLLLTDGKAGHENQSRAFVRALGGEPEVAEIHFRSKFHKALSYLLDRVGLRTTALFTGMPDLPRGGFAAVVGTGSGTFYAVKAAARKLGVKGGVVLYPRGYDLASFDCILAPAFDRPAKRSNVIEIPANLVSADAAFYDRGVAAFCEKTGCAADDLAKREIVAVIVGGPNKCSTMTADWMKARLDEIFVRGADAAHTEPTDGRRAPLYFVTTSRRTPAEVEKVVDAYPWDFKLLYSQDHFNPIPAFVKLAKKLYVTAESTGMLSEACTFGAAEVVPLDNLNPGPHKFRRFVEGLVAGGYAKGNRKVDLSDAFSKARERMGL